MSTLKRTFSFILLFFIALVTVQCSSQNSAELVLAGDEYSKKGDYSKAFDTFLKATELDPKNVDALYRLGGIYNYQKNYDKAAQSFKNVIKLDPTHFNARYSLGFTYEQLGNPELAKIEFDRYHSLKKRFESLIIKD
jgi:tetratricopeptide (TPR) repeat protein